MTMPPMLDPARHALFLDFDGTLVELQDDPQAVRVATEDLDRLIELQSRLNNAFAVLSGRRIADLDRFLSPLRFAAAGVHGLERREAAGAETVHLAGPSMLDPVREALRMPLAAEPGLRLEDKGTALVVHYRGRPELKVMADRVADEAVRGVADLSVMRGHDIVEIHIAGMDKGRALASFMTQDPFRERVPVYLGDDTTDEFAFAEVARLGGIGVKVGPGESVASHRLAAVDSVHRWLALEPDADGGAN
ncbi:trehalose-phosphatase [Aureimonas jatrophae]|nr:trehalose-phosphatase [Aureimonas jatrophae]MBB3951582.1 trehalose 6-phosphate phosphatase [Aureimonas jatrophae]